MQTLPLEEDILLVFYWETLHPLRTLRNTPPLLNATPNMPPTFTPGKVQESGTTHHHHPPTHHGLKGGWVGGGGGGGDGWPDSCIHMES